MSYFYIAISIVVVGDIPPGLPAVIPPPFETTVGNTTYTAGQMISHLGSGIIVLPLVALLGNIAVVKVFCKYLFYPRRQQRYTGNTSCYKTY